jgi:putative RecB family exonuclease
MPIYSHSKLSTYEQCPLKYRLCYIDNIKRYEEGVEAFLGQRVHEILEKHYKDLRYTRMNSLKDLLDYYERLWDKNWHDSIIIAKPDLIADDYRLLGRKLIEMFYNKYSPFDSDITIGTEMRLSFSLDDENRYRMTGIIDRLSRTPANMYQIHDYKTSAYLPDQQSADADRQLALYHLAVQKKWPEAQNIKLIWHYLAFDTELVSYRLPTDISALVQNTTKLIDEIEMAQDFKPKESLLCDWCEYPDLCPLRKHIHMVEALPVNEYLNEPGVVLVNKLSELREKEKFIKQEVEKVKEAIIDYARRKQMEIIKGSDRKARVKFDTKLKFPGKNDAERRELDALIKDAGKWMEVSQLDTTALTKIVDQGLWSRELVDQVIEHGIIEQSANVYLSKLKDEEDI